MFRWTGKNSETGSETLVEVAGEGDVDHRNIGRNTVVTLIEELGFIQGRRAVNAGILF